MIYGNLPEDLGEVELDPVEMMFWMYCPISTPGMGSSVELPDNLVQFAPIIERIVSYDYDEWSDNYVYLTAKTLWVSGDYIGNRPGWHADGFGTRDINYVWYDRAPTEFLEDDFTLPADCTDAMAIMESRAASLPSTFYPSKHLLRLDQSVIHRCPVGFDAGMRTFVKVSLSADRYDLEGNSINHRLAERWALKPRQAERNHPSTRGGGL
jgi:hypothetical protein